jgi:hypothetical protein
MRGNGRALAIAPATGRGGLSRVCSAHAVGVLPWVAVRAHSVSADDLGAALVPWPIELGDVTHAHPALLSSGMDYIIRLKRRPLGHRLHRA